MTEYLLAAAVVAVILGAIFLHRKFPTQAHAAEAQAGAVMADAHAGVVDLASKAMDLLHTEKQSNAALTAVVVSPDVQSVINARQPAPAASPAIAVVGAATPLPTGAPMTVPTLYQGLPRDPEYAYPDQPDYKKDGYEPPWGWVPVPRQWMNLPRWDKGNPNYHEGDAPGPRASEAQMALIRVSWDSSLPQATRSQAIIDLAASLGFPGSNVEQGSAANVAVAQLLQSNPLNG